MKKKILWVIIILVVLAAILGGWYFYKTWWPQRQAMISLGLAESKFPWRAYTQEELNKLFPQIRYADVPTRVTPEQTYANFREALRTNNLELALEQLSLESKNYAENKSTIKKADRDGKFQEAYSSYPEKIEKESMSGSISSYFYFISKGGKEFKTHISFLKDANGDWKIDSL